MLYFLLPGMLILGLKAKFLGLGLEFVALAGLECSGVGMNHSAIHFGI